MLGRSYQNTQEPPQGYRSLIETENPKVGDLIFIRANEAT